MYNFIISIKSFCRIANVGNIRNIVNRRRFSHSHPIFSRLHLNPVFAHDIHTLHLSPIFAPNTLHSIRPAIYIRRRRTSAATPTLSKQNLSRTKKHTLKRPTTASEPYFDKIAVNT